MFQTSQGPLELGVLAGPVQHVLVKELSRERTVWAPYWNMWPLPTLSPQRLVPSLNTEPPALPWHGGGNGWAICLSSVVWLLDEGDGESDRDHCDPQVSLKPVLSAHCLHSPQTTTNKIANRSLLLLKPGILPHKSNKSNPLSQPLLETALCIFFILRRFGHCLRLLINLLIGFCDIICGHLPTPFLVPLPDLKNSSAQHGVASLLVLALRGRGR